MIWRPSPESKRDRSGHSGHTGVPIMCCKSRYRQGSRSRRCRSGCNTRPAEPMSESPLAAARPAAGRAAACTRKTGARSSCPEGRAPFAPAICSGCAAPTVRKSWTFRIVSDRSGGASIQPTRHPVTDHVLLMLLTSIVRSRMPASPPSVVFLRRRKGCARKSRP